MKINFHAFYLKKQKKYILGLTPVYLKITFDGERAVVTTKLTRHELQQDCLCYLQPNGKLVKAFRLFLGKEFNGWTKKLTEYFKVDQSFIKV